MSVLEKLENRPVVIYGLSTETERVLSEWNGRYKIYGLLDGFKDSGTQFGYPILSIGDVVKIRDVIIIVVARPGSSKAIAKRIGNICRENKVELFDIRGNDLLTDGRVVYDFSSVKGYTREELKKEICKAEAVSFDLFDTLVVRNVLSSTDVLNLVGSRLKERGIKVSDFAIKRLGVEKEISQGHAPRLCRIYSELIKNENISDISVEELAELEYSTEKNLLRPRVEMIDIVNYAKSLGKKVCITSESYYSKEQIQDILSSVGVENMDELVISCEYDTPKTGRLYEKLLEVTATDNILHIGDDILADIESSGKYGIKAFQIYSAGELLDIVGGLELLKYENSLSDRIRIGMFTADIFNSPFQFEGDKKIHIDDAYNIGYLIAAPMIIDFTRWFGQKVMEMDIPNIWFCARDGYLIKQLFEIMFPGIRSDYFLTSRTAAIRAGVENEKDIEYVDSMKYGGNIADNLMSRFGIDIEKADNEKTDCNKDGLLKYAGIILDKAKRKKENNLKYIDSLNVVKGNAALFDFVAKGTSQLYISKIVSNEIIGLYFLQLEPEYMKDKGLDIIPFYKEEEREKSAIFDNYYILETLLTAPYPSVNEFDDDGNPVYAKETRSDGDIRCFMKAQDGIIDYLNRYLSICPEGEITENKMMDESLLKLIHNIEIRDNDFMRLNVEDPFFNRMTDITDVI